jgi:hypothetical protein
MRPVSVSGARVSLERLTYKTSEFFSHMIKYGEIAGNSSGSTVIAVSKYGLAVERVSNLLARRPSGGERNVCADDQPWTNLGEFERFPRLAT